MENIKKYGSILLGIIGFMTLGVYTVVTSYHIEVIELYRWLLTGTFAIAFMSAGISEFCEKEINKYGLFTIVLACINFFAAGAALYKKTHNIETLQLTLFLIYMLSGIFYIWIGIKQINREKFL